MSFQSAIDNGLIRPITLQEIQDTHKKWKAYGNPEVLGVVVDRNISSTPFWCLLEPTFDANKDLMYLDGKRNIHLTRHFAWDNIIQLWDIQKLQKAVLPKNEVLIEPGQEYLQAIGDRKKKMTAKTGCNIGLNIVSPQYKINAMGCRIHIGWTPITNRGNHGDPEEICLAADRSTKPTMELILLPDAAAYATPSIKPQMRIEQHIRAQQRIDRMSYEELTQFLINHP